jgi:predicted ABC-type transport system involved in lysophospholipase L1 biosynthesis ATPase subunit
LLPVPSQAFGLAVLTAVLAAALVSAPLMIASAEQAAWEQELARVGQNGMGVTFGSSTLAGRQVSATSRVARIGELDDAVIASAAEAGLNAPVSLLRLDEGLSVHVLTTLREVYAAAGTGVLIASHDPVMVASADRVVRLSDGRVDEAPAS